jgi:secreted PhoX family phosphatase
LTYLGFGSLATLGNPLLQGCGRRIGASGSTDPFFSPIQRSSADRLILPEGFRSDLVGVWNDKLDTADGGRYGETFGFNADFNAYFPLDGLQGGQNSAEGFLWTNHEYPDPVFVSAFIKKPKKLEQIRAEKACVGGSIIRVKREGDKWVRVPDAMRTKRFSALGPQMEVTGPASRVVPVAKGTLANCSGGRSPWLTTLSCEENFQDYNDKYRWTDAPGEGIDVRQYGWVVEVDPYGELPPVKHSALGRFAHENVAWRIGPTKKLVLYMGDDATDQHLYKFVSAESYDENAPRADRRKLLENGTLYVAEFGKGAWLPLDVKRNSQLRALGFTDQADVLMRCRDAAKAIGATPLDRPEDCEVHPLDGTLYVALTNNLDHGNYYGQIVRLIEENDNPESEGFRYEIFLAGGPQTGLACPDNLTFDREGNLWVATDMSYKGMDRAIEQLGNNGLFFVPTSGSEAGTAFQFASAPAGAELTGPWWTEDWKTLFLSVQHPGEGTLNASMPLSNWPDGGKSMPRPGVVAISGF